MNRRDFLLMHTQGSKRTADLSCEKLFIHYEGLCSGYHQAPEECGTFDDADWWAGEPPLSIANSDPDDFFRSLQTEIRDVDTLTVLDMEWLKQGDFRIRVETLLAAFRARGSEVIYQSPAQTSQQYSELA